MHEHDDGTVGQDGLRFRERAKYPGEQAERITYPVTGVVTQVFTIKDPQNRDRETVLLDIKCLQLGIDLFKVPWIGANKSSLDDYIFFAPEAPNKNVDDSQFNANRVNMKVAENDSVLVVFANASVHQPYAVAMLPHALTETQSPSPKPKKEDDIPFKVRMRGTNFFIDKNGNVRYETTDTYNKEIPKKKKFEVDLNENGKTQRVFVEIDNTGEGLFCITVTKEDGKKNEICLDAMNNTLSILNENDTGANLINMDDAGIQVSTDGDYTETIAGNKTINVTDQTFNITGNYTMAITGNAEITANGSAKFSGTGGTEVGSGGSVTNILGSIVNLAGGGAPVARLGDMAIGTGNLGAPVISNIAQGSPKVTSG